MNISQGFTSGKALKVLQELEDAIRDNPHIPVFTSSKEFGEYIKGKYTEADIRVCERPADIMRSTTVS